MLPITSTETAEERTARLQRLEDKSYQDRLDLIRHYRQQGYGVAYVVTDYSDGWHPYDVAIFDNIVAAQELASHNDDWDWSPSPMFTTPEQYSNDAQELRS